MSGLLWTPVRVLLFSLLVFSFIRVGYYLTYPEYFASLALSQLPGTFLFGWRFDLAITVLVTALFLLPLLLPFRFPGRQGFTQISLWCAFGALVIAWGLNLGDLAYFGEVYRHAGRELLLMSDDVGMLVELALTNRLGFLLLAMGGVLVLGVLWRLLVVRPALRQPLTGRLLPRAGFSLLGFLVLVVAGRGAMLTGKPLSLVDAYAAGDEQHAALALNGAFAVVHSVRRSAEKVKPPLAFFTPEELAQRQQQYGWQQEQPFVRSWTGAQTPSRQRNVVMILLESWSYQYIDGLAGTSYGATPYMDSLLERSRVWENAYAAAQRSIEGVQAVLTSVPLLESHTVVGWGLEQNRMSRMADMLGDEGYQTVMLQSSNRRSFHMDGIAATLGFDEYFGKEDLPLRRNYPGEVPRFGWDYETLMFLGDYLEQRSEPERPFFSFVFTGTTHEPFPDPGKEFHLYPHKPGTKEAYLNTLRYSDWSLEQFMRRAAEQPWYEDTVFVFVADHVLRASAEDLHASFKIPLIVYTPDQSLAPGREERFASQYDILPTMMTLLGLEQPVASFGRSLLEPVSQGPEGVMVQRGSVTGWLAPQGWFTFSASGPLQAAGLYEDDEKRHTVEEWLKVRMQLADQRLLHNEWLPKHFAAAEQ